MLWVFAGMILMIADFFVFYLLYIFFMQNFSKKGKDLNQNQLNAFMGAGIVIMIGGVLILGFSDAKALICGILLSIGILEAVVFLLVLLFSLVDEEKKAKKTAVDSQKKAFYLKCKESNITLSTNSPVTNDVRLIAKLFGLSDAETIRKTYAEGKQIIEREKVLQQQKLQQAMNEKINAARDKDRKKYDDEKEKSTVRGKRKYIQKAQKESAEWRKKYAQLEKLKMTDLYQKHKEDNWGWAGGIASGIAGPAAGLMAAQEAHEQNVAYNQKVDEYNMSLIKAGLGPTDFELKKKLALGELAGKFLDLEKKIDEINNKLLDDERVQDKLAHLQFDIQGTVNKNSGYLSLKVKATADEISLLGHPASLDGSVRILVKSENGQKVGEAYYNADGFDRLNLKTVGFGASRARSVIAVPTVGESFSEDKTYTYEVEPVALWVIEQ